MNGSIFFWIIGFITAGLTAFYMFRLVFLTFYGKGRMDKQTKDHLHESPRLMTVPLMVLAVLAVIGGYVGMPHIFGATNYIEHWLEPVIHAGGSGMTEHALSTAGDASMEWTLMVASVALAFVGIMLAWYFYRKSESAAGVLKQKLSGLHRILLNKYYIDEIYGAIVIRPVVYSSLFLWKIFDVMVIDGLINGIATLGQDIGQTLRYSQTGRVRTYATIFAFGVVLLLGLFIEWGLRAN